MASRRELVCLTHSAAASCVAVRGSEHDSEGRGGAIAVKHLGRGVHVLRVPASEFVPTRWGAEQPARALDVVVGHGAPRGPKGA